MKQLSLILALSFAALPAFADGDVAAGEQQFNRQCGACHVVQNADGVTLAGRNLKPGPNLYGVVGRAAGTVPNVRYGDSIMALGATGFVWTQETFVAYVQDPTKFLRDTLDDRRARSKMAYRVRQESEAVDLFAYLASVSP